MIISNNVNDYIIIVHWAVRSMVKKVVKILHLAEYIILRPLISSLNQHLRGVMIRRFISVLLEFLNF